MKKGTHVWLIREWDGKGTIAVERCTVDSWGKRQIHLRRLAGDMTQHRFYTDHVNREAPGTHVLPVEGTDIQTAALGYARECLTYREMQLRRCLSIEGASAGYLKAVRADLEALHEPRVIDRTNDAGRLPSVAVPAVVASEGAL